MYAMIEHEQAPTEISFSQHIGDQVVGCIGQRFIFPDRDGELDRLRAILRDIGGIDPSAEGYASELRLVLGDFVASSASEQIRTHANMLRAGKVMIADPEGRCSWQDIGSRDKEEFGALRERVKPDVIEVVSAQFAGAIDVDSEARDEIEESFTTKLSSLLDEIGALIPAPCESPIQAVSRGRMLLIAVGATRIEPHYCEDVLPKDSDLPKKVSRKVRNLNALLEELAQNPEATIVRTLLETQGEELERLRARVVAAVDDNLVRVNGGLLTKLPKKSKTRHSESPMIKNSFVDTRGSSKSEPKPEYEVDAEKELSVRQETIDVSFPWINEGKATTVQAEIIGQNGHRVVVAHAISQGRLSDIAEVSRLKSPSSEAAPNMYDQIEQTLARRVIAGIMPYENANGAKGIKTSSGTPYGYASIWYTFDRSPNAPRVYFTLKNADEVMKGDELSRLGLPKEGVVIAIVAETDKAHQIDVLRILTGKRRQELRKAGAGSV